MSTMPSQPMIHPWVTIVEGDDSVVARHAHRAVVFQGPGAKALLPDLIGKLQGSTTTADVLSSYPDDHQPLIEGALTRLAQHNLLIEAAGLDLVGISENTLRAATALSEALSGSVALSEITQRLTSTKIHLLSDLDNADRLEDLMRSSGFGTVELLRLSHIESLEQSVDDDSIVVLAPSRHTADELRTMNELALRIRCRWTHVLPYDGSFATVGPLYLPGETGCYQCFQHRRRSTIETIDQQRLVDEQPQSVLRSPLHEWTSLGQEYTAWGMLAHLLALEALRLDWTPAALAGHMHTVQWAGASVDVERHRLFRVPRCSACGPMDLGVPQPWFEQAPSGPGELGGGSQS